MKQLLNKNQVYGLIWIQSLIAMIGSLFFSEVLKYPPCVLCWYQRIFIYPLVFIVAIGILINEKKLHLYILSLAVPGFFIALYHNFLYYKLIPESNGPCISGISCTTKYIEWFGFVTIPFLSLVAFAVVIWLALYSRKLKQPAKD